MRQRSGAASIISIVLEHLSHLDRISYITSCLMGNAKGVVKMIEHTVYSSGCLVDGVFCLSLK